jgi:hypothetical protein
MALMLWLDGMMVMMRLASLHMHVAVGLQDQ